MSKTIEEAARDFVANYYDLEEYGDEVSDIEIDNSEECFIGGANYVQSLPLSDRLTAAEKERVKGLHYHLTNVLAYCHPSADKIVEATIHDIESIFGKEMFEKEGE